MTVCYSTHRPRNSTLVMACPDNATIKNLKDYAIANSIPNPTGFPPNPRLHVSLLRCPNFISFTQSDSVLYPRPIMIGATSIRPIFNIPPHKKYATITVSFESSELFRRKTYFHSAANMALRSNMIFHITLSYYADPHSLRYLPPLGFDLVFDCERIEGWSGTVRPPELHNELRHSIRTMKQTRAADQTGKLLHQYKR